MSPWKEFADRLGKAPRPARDGPIRLVAFDLDGVLVEQESSWVAVHRHFGVGNEESLHAFLRGEISDEEFIRRDVALWTAQRPRLTLDYIDEVLRRDLTLMPGARDTLRALHDAGIHTAIVSGGLEPAAAHVADELGIPTVSANALHVDAQGQLIGTGLVRTPLADKATPLRNIAKSFGVPPGQVAAIGNSSPDISMFRACGLGIAFRPTDEYVTQFADVVVPGPSLADVLPHLLPP